jgi:drug/metabolite transporter (DMT)-like permease
VLGASAALLWAVGTVLGRKVVGRLDPMSLTAARFWLGLPVAAALFGLLEPGPAIGLGDVPAVLMLAAVPGLLGLMLYYRGLRDTPASVATVAELAFPLSALVVNRIAFDSTLTATQAIGTATLMTTVVAVAAVDRRRGADGLGVVYRRQASPARGVA